MVVIVAEKVQETMKGQDPKLNSVGMTLLRRLSPRDPGGNDDVPELSVLVVSPKGEHVGSAVLPSVLTVEIPDGGVAHERDAPLS